MENLYRNYTDPKAAWAAVPVYVLCVIVYCFLKVCDSKRLFSSFWFLFILAKISLPMAEQEDASFYIAQALPSPTLDLRAMVSSGLPLW